MTEKTRTGPSANGKSGNGQAANGAAPKSTFGAKLRSPVGKRVLLAAAVVVLSAGPLILQGPDELQTPLWVWAIGRVGLLAFVVLSAGAFLAIYDRPVYDRFRDLVLLSSLLVGMIWSTRFIVILLPEVPPFALPVPLAAMLATLLLSAREGLLIAIVTTIAGLLLGFTSGAIVIGTLVWSVASVTAMAFMTERRRILLVGLAVIGSGIASAFLAELAAGVTVRTALVGAGWAIVGGSLATVLAYGLLPFFENVFGLTTDMRLLELGSPAHPLLRELMTKAPGTYAHSVATANLAETAAEDIRAKPLLARVGAYYHDIGKIRRPEFFFENLQGDENPHDTTKPSLSTLIITAHVRDGVEMAHEHGLPEEVEAIIRQHHGTSLVSYFFSKAAERDAAVFEADFRYQGEKPQSREAALVMLADASEAAVRALKKPSAPRVEATVRRVIDEKLADGQLDDADLTLSDIDTIARTYSRMLTSMYHARVEYPDTQAGRANAYQHHEPSRA